jgi:hypothetical protein
MSPLVLLTGLAVLSQASPEKRKPAKPTVPVLRANAVDARAVKQVTSASREDGSRIATPVSCLEGGLPYMPNKKPILAMAEATGWFFYATSVARDAKTGEPVFFISGYAIQRGGCHVVWFSVW